MPILVHKGLMEWIARTDAIATTELYVTMYLASAIVCQDFKAKRYAFVSELLHLITCLSETIPVSSPMSIWQIWTALQKELQL